MSEAEHASVMQEIREQTAIHFNWNGGKKCVVPCLTKDGPQFIIYPFKQEYGVWNRTMKSLRLFVLFFVLVFGGGADYERVIDP